jgi:RimJ/RimL family protein N-acetyltransferase
MTDASSAVRLRRMRPEELPGFMEHSIVSYATGIREQGGQTAAFARQKSEADHAAILPNGLETPGHSLWIIEAGGERVGLLWLAERDSGGRHVIFIYDIEIDEGHRGNGYGRAAMALAEDQARALGIGRIELNVFGGNEVARQLYRSVGYVETSVQMAKDLEGLGA